MGRQWRWLSATRMACLIALPLSFAYVPSVLALTATINGVDGDVEDNISAYLEGIDKKQYTQTRLEGEIRSRTKVAMRVYGYYEPTVEIQIDPAVVLNIDSGPRVEIQELAINVDGDAKDDPTFKDALDSFPLKVGDPLV